MDNNEMIKQLQKEMDGYAQEFTENENAINELILKREQIRGKYTSLYELLVKLTGEQSNTSDANTINSEMSNTEALQENSVNNTASNTLSNQEMETLKNTLKDKESINENVNNSKVDDIPDYLK